MHFFANASFSKFFGIKNPRILGDGNYLITHALQLFTLAKVSIIVYGAVRRVCTSYTAPQFSQKVIVTASSCVPSSH